MKTTPCLHWSEGGTGLTNFNISDLPVYKEAIRILEEQHPFLQGKFWIEDKPMLNPAGVTKNYMSLHRDGNYNEYSSSFYKIFNEISIWTPGKGFSLKPKHHKSLEFYENIH